MVEAGLTPQMIQGMDVFQNFPAVTDTLDHLNGHGFGPDLKFLLLMFDKGDLFTGNSLASESRRTCG